MIPTKKTNPGPADALIAATYEARIRSIKSELDALSSEGPAFREIVGRAVLWDGDGRFYIGNGPFSAGGLSYTKAGAFRFLVEVATS